MKLVFGGVLHLSLKTSQFFSLSAGAARMMTTAFTLGVGGDVNLRGSRSEMLFSIRHAFLGLFVFLFWIRLL